MGTRDGGLEQKGVLWWSSESRSNRKVLGAWILGGRGGANNVAETCKGFKLAMSEGLV